LAPRSRDLCVLKENFAFLSRTVGDLETPEARDFLRESLALMERITQCRPHLVACDLHPEYYTSRIAGRWRAGRSSLSRTTTPIS
jgi:hydrogenase maturation protein HypF